MVIYYTTEEVLSGAFLQRALAAYGAAGGIGRTEQGKPYLQNGAAHFNLTHTEGLTAVAVGTQRVGLDAERRKPRNNAALLSRLRPSEREEDFYELWTAKEAYVKYVGGTLAGLLRDLCYEKGVLRMGDAPLKVCLKHWEREGCTLCLCTEKEEEISFVRL